MSSANDFIVENGVLVKYVGQGGEVIIPEGIVEIGYEAFQGNFLGESIPVDSVVIPDGVTKIQDRAFEWCELKTITIPDTVKSIGELSFRGCKKLEEVTLPSGITHIPYLAFGECESLKHVNVPNGVDFGPECFRFCTALKGEKLIANAHTIQEYAFEDCKSIKEIIIPDSFTKVENHAFAGCKGVKTLILSKNLIAIGEAAFKGCQMTSIIIPDGVTEIGKDAFSRCNKITSAGPVGSGSDYEYPWTEEIPNNAFSGLRKLKKAVLPASIKKVGNNAFKDCKELTDLTMPKEAKIGKTSFKGCDMIGEIKEPEGTAGKIVSDKNDNTDYFIVNGRLEKYNGTDEDIIIPEGVVIIGRYAFSDNKQIKSVTIPDSVETVEQEAFFGCYCLETIKILGEIKSVGMNAFGDFYFNIFYKQREKLELSVYSAIPIRVFSKAAQDQAVETFSRRLSDFDSNTIVFEENIRFVGTHLKQTKKYNKEKYYHYLIENEVLRHAVLAQGAIPSKDIDWLVTELQADGYIEFIAELLEYNNRITSKA